MPDHLLGLEQRVVAGCGCNLDVAARHLGQGAGGGNVSHRMHGERSDMVAPEEAGLRVIVKPFREGGLGIVD